MNKKLLAQLISEWARPRNVLALGLAVSPAFAFADDATGNEMDVLVVTGTSIKQTLTSNIAQSTMRTEADLTEIPRSAVVINRDLLDQQSASDMSDVLSNISNVSESNNYGGTRDQFSIRGFDASVYEDGTRIYGLASDKAVLEDIEYVEVVKGPESILYGNMNPGGLINIIGKKPQEEQSSQIALDLDEHGKQRLSFDSTGSANEDGTLLYRIVGVADDSEGWRDDSDSRQTYIAPSVTWVASEDTQITLSYKYNKEKVPFDRGTLAVLNSSGGWDFLDIGSKRLGAGFSSQERTTHKFGLEIEHDITDVWTTRLKLKHQKREYDGTRVHFYASSAASRGTTAGIPIYGQDQNKNAFDGTINRYIGGDDTSSDTDIVSWENQLTFDIGEAYHQVTTGIDATRYRENKTTSTSASWSGLNQLTTAYSGRFLGTSDPNSGAYDYNSDNFTNVSNPDDMFKIQDESQTLTEYGIYLNDLIEYGDWHFVAGVRADRYSRKYTKNYDETLQSAVSALVTLENEDTKRPYETNVSGQLGALYQITDNVSAFSNIATSYMPNNAYDSVANHWVDPQDGTQYEIGTKLALLDKKLNLTLSTYRIDLDNVAYAGDVTGSYDVYKQRSRGFEIDGDYAITDQLTAIFSYGYTDVEFVNAPDTVNKPVNIPENNASTWLFYNDGEEWGAGTGIVYVGDRAGNRRKGYDYTLDAYTLVNMTAWYQPAFADRQLRLQLSVANLFDEDYYTASSDSTQNAVYLGSPRTVSVKASYKF
ncbi:TonB-dependent siderophore receptor [Vibrio mangrovi]|uniref:Ferrichrome-iron receptor n=1 Tax=Vibrio mangrovi TaxID=474394 RepID=A0A1Y6ISZ1_9VIBR|nr:TonB-dependent siderophore receptor [Vibrio mangrovi]MDW6003281.1 TonB-dependent siderophore receptor [Vibrio mangrovi]SMR99930.1 Ferrichrome-iron receptor precursor [Vibrio mangrovi]